MRWPRNSARPKSARRSGPTASPRPTTRPTRPCSPATSPTTGSRSRGWSSSRCRSSREELQAMPARTQITRHDCVEGWSCIAKWTGVPLALVLDQARVETGGALRRLPLPRYDRARAVGRRQILRDRRPDRRPPPADDPRLRPQRPAAAGRERRAASACGSSASWATRGRNMSTASSWWTALPASAAARAAIGRTMATTGMPASELAGSPFPWGGMSRGGDNASCLGYRDNCRRASAHRFAGESSESCRRRGNRPKSLRQKNRRPERHSGKSGQLPRAEGVSVADRVPAARVSQASDRGARNAAFRG